MPVSTIGQGPVGARPVGSGPVGSELPAVTGFNAYRQLILDSITSDSVEVNALIAELANVPVTAVVRTDDNTVTIILPALPNYNITADENITFTLPSEVLVTSTEDIIGTPTATILTAAQIFKIYWAINSNILL